MIVPVRHAGGTGRSLWLPEDVRNRRRAFPRELPAGIAYRETRVISPRESPGSVPRASKSPRNWLYVRTKLTGQLVRLNRQTYRTGCGAGAALRVIRLLCSRPLTLLRSCTHARTHTLHKQVLLTTARPLVRFVLFCKFSLVPIVCSAWRPNPSGTCFRSYLEVGLGLSRPWCRLL